MNVEGERWWERAACKGMAPMFDAEGDGNRLGRYGDKKRRAVAERYEAAVKVCERCPVRAECLADARPGRDEGVRAGKVLTPLFSAERKTA